jgi:hypothetical protein
MNTSSSSSSFFHPSSSNARSAKSSDPAQNSSTRARQSDSQPHAASSSTLRQASSGIGTSALELPTIPTGSFFDSFSSSTASDGLDLPLIPAQVDSSPARRVQPAQQQLQRSDYGSHQRVGTEPVEPIYRAKVRDREREMSEPELRASRSCALKPDTSFDQMHKDDQDVGGKMVASSSSSSAFSFTDRADRDKQQMGMATASPDRLPVARGMAQHRASPRPQPRSQPQPPSYQGKSDRPDLRVATGSQATSAMSSTMTAGARRAPPERLDLASPGKDRYKGLEREEAARETRRRVVTEPAQGVSTTFCLLAPIVR